MLRRQKGGKVKTVKGGGKALCTPLISTIAGGGRGEKKGERQPGASFSTIRQKSRGKNRVTEEKGERYHLITPSRREGREKLPCSSS